MAVVEYLNVEGFKTRTAMPPGSVEELEARRPGYLASRIAVRTAKIVARLAKRYLTPFGIDPVAPSTVRGAVPDVVLEWLTALVTYDAYRALGFDPSSMQDQTILDDAKQAEDDMKEAADSEVGLFELPLRQTDAETGVTQGGPFSYSEPGPYEWADVQREAVRHGR